MSRRAAWLWALVALVAVVILAAATAPDGDGRPSIEDRLRTQLRLERVRWAAREAGYVNTLRHDPTVQEALTLASILGGVSRAALFSIATCESSLRPYALNGQYVGLFQLGSGFWSASRFNVPGLSRWSPYVSAIAAAEVMGRQGFGQWACRP